MPLLLVDVERFWPRFKGYPALTFEDVYFSHEFQSYALALEDESDQLVAYELLLRLQERLEEARADDPFEYEAYLQTPEWRERAQRERERADYRCRLCNEAGPLEAHHRTYERLGAEAENDLTALCHRCHDSWHRYIGFPSL
jgi:hypothetical protein